MTSRREVLAWLGTAAAAACAGSTRPAVDRPLFRGIGLAAGDDRAALAREVGFDFLTGGVRPTLLPDVGDEEFAPRLAQLRALPLPVRCCNVFLPGSLRVTGPAADHAAILAYAEKVFARARTAGVERIVFGSAAARNVPPGFSHAEARAQFVALLQRLGPLAQQAGIVVMPENLNRGECNFGNRVAELAAMVAEAGAASIRLNADLFHMLREAEDPQALADAVPVLHQLEIAEPRDRTIPGIAGADFRPYFRVLRQRDWTGWLNVEAAAATAAQYRQMFLVLAEQVRDAR